MADAQARALRVRARRDLDAEGEAAAAEAGWHRQRRDADEVEDQRRAIWIVFEDRRRHAHAGREVTLFAQVLLEGGRHVGGQPDTRGRAESIGHPPPQRRFGDAEITLEIDL